MTVIGKLKTRWLQVCIAYHRRQAASYNVRSVRGYRRDRYNVWLQNMRHHHVMKAHALERELASSRPPIATGDKAVAA